jgi:hypothetical protein
MWDIFVEIDYLQVADYHHRPSDATLNIVIGAFARRNIALHFDTGKPPFDLGGGNAITVTPEPQGTSLDDARQFRASHFDRSTRGNVFHYCAAVHSMIIGPCQFGSAPTPGVLFVYRTPPDPLPEPPPEPFPHERSAHTLMHELGHNVGLRHGGFEDLEPKPNYRSVMNTIWYRVFIDTDCDADYGLCNPEDPVCPFNELGDVPPPCQINMNPEEAIDYSDEVLPTLDEQSLNEAAGICGNVAIDWDQDGVIEPSVARDFNQSGSAADVYQGSNDWNNIRLIMNRPPVPEDCGEGGGAGDPGPPEDIDCIVE